MLKFEALHVAKWLDYSCITSFISEAEVLEALHDLLPNILQDVHDHIENIGIVQSALKLILALLNSGTVLSHSVPPALGVRGTSRFTVVSRHPNVCRRPSVCVRLCQTLFMWYFLQFVTNDFQIFWYGDHWQVLDWIIFLLPWVNFQGHRAHVSKLTLFMRYFL